MNRSEQSSLKKSELPERIPTLDLIEAKVYLEGIQDGTQADTLKALGKAAKLLPVRPEEEPVITATRNTFQALIRNPDDGADLLQYAIGLIASLIDERLKSFGVGLPQR